MAAPVATRLIPAAQYVRASTGLQTYSIEHQLACIAGFAEGRGYQIIATYSDEARSGLDLAGRPALQALLAQALSPRPGFQAILVYDVSRWGRFQDLDEGAHYEFLCRQAGLGVEYCAEPFDNDGSPEADLIKQLKRSIAAEFSRELSARLVLAKERVAAKGYRPSGHAPFGYLRQVVDARGRPVCVLKRGEHKSAHNHRVRLTPGPAREVETVRKIFQLYAVTGMKPAAIAAWLRASAHPARSIHGWTASAVRGVLRQEAYAGVLLWGRTQRRMKGPMTRPAPASWRRVTGAWQPLISQERFDEAQRLLGQGRRSNEAALADLRHLLREHGRLDTGLIDEAPGMLGVGAYRQRFGGLRCAYALIGYRPARRARR